MVLLLGIVVLVLALGGVSFVSVLSLCGPKLWPLSLAAASCLPPPPPSPAIGPSGSPIAPAATTILSTVQVASAVDSTSHPTHLTNTVAVGQTLYITFDLHLNGRTGYVQARFYRDREFIEQTNPLRVAPGDLTAAVDASFPTAIPNAAAELYWCQQADCSDRQLVAVVHFIVTAASSHLAVPGQVAMVYSAM